MDSRILQVLDVYHAMIDEEQKSRTVRSGPFNGKSSASESIIEGGHDPRIRAVGPQTGQLINILAKSLQVPTILEIGTSYGYSGIWLAEAAKAAGGQLITMEIHDYKAAFARDMAAKAGLAECIDFRVGDAVAMIADLPIGIDFVLLDLWKDLYVPCLEAFYPKLNPGAIIVADNMIRPGNEDVKRYGEAVRAKPGITSVLLPVGSGLEVSRYEP